MVQINTSVLHDSFWPVENIFGTSSSATETVKSSQILKSLSYWSALPNQWTKLSEYSWAEILPKPRNVDSWSINLTEDKLVYSYEGCFIEHWTMTFSPSVENRYELYCYDNKTWAGLTLIFLKFNSVMNAKMNRTNETQSFQIRGTADVAKHRWQEK